MKKKNFENRLLSDQIVEFEMQLNRLSKKTHLRTLNEISKMIDRLEIVVSIHAELSEALDKVYEIVEGEYQSYIPKD